MSKKRASGFFLLNVVVVRLGGCHTTLACSLLSKISYSRQTVHSRRLWVMRVDQFSSRNGPHLRAHSPWPSWTAIFMNKRQPLLTIFARTPCLVSFSFSRGKWHNWDSKEGRKSRKISGFCNIYCSMCSGWKQQLVYTKYCYWLLSPLSWNVAWWCQR